MTRPEIGWTVLLPLLTAAAVLSLVGWRADVLACACETCPDGHCGYAQRIYAALCSGQASEWTKLHAFAERYLHAQIPLSAVLVALAMVPLGSPVAGFAVVSALATWLAWRAVLRVVRASWSLDAWTISLLAIAFWTTAVVLRGFVRPATDAVGMACCAWALWAIGEHAVRREKATGVRAFVLQVIGLTSRVSFVPMLGMPVVAELVRGAPSAARMRSALRAGIVFGVLPAAMVAGTVLVLGIDHTDAIWRFAHAEQFVSIDVARDLPTALLAAGGGYLLVAAVGLIGAHRSARSQIAWRLHLAWIVIYVTFLVVGGGALWPRYFAPIVPSVMVVAAPGIAALVQRRRSVACCVVAAGALAGWGIVLRGIEDPVAVLGLVVREIRAGGLTQSVRERLAVVRPGALEIVASQAPEQAGAAADGDLETAWRTDGPQQAGTFLVVDLGRPRPVEMVRLLAPWGEGLETPVLETSSDGLRWKKVDVRREIAERRGAEATILHFPVQRFRYFRISVGRSGEAPWSVAELQLLVRRGARREAPD